MEGLAIKVNRDDTSIRVSNLSFAYLKDPVLKGVDFTLESGAVGGLEQGFVVSTRAALEGEREECVVAARTVLDSSFQDAEGLYFIARSLLHVGAVDEGLEALRRVTKGGLCCPTTFRADPWLEAARGSDVYAALLERADAGHQAGRKLYEEVGGELLLGVPA